MGKTIIKKQNYINHQQALDEALAKFKNSAWLAVDTEFSREQSFYPILSLVQLSDGKTSVVIDILVDLDFSQLVAILIDKKTLKVFHSARQDVEALHYRFKIAPTPILDTQIAALFLGFEEAPGFDKMVKHFLHRDISKTLQFSNWLKRPLLDELIEYAASDAKNLADLFPILERELVTTRKMPLLTEECTDQFKVKDFYPDDAELLIKFTNFFKDELKLIKALAVIRAREAVAKKNNISRNFIATNEVLANYIKGYPLQPSQNFDELVALCEKYADPKKDAEIVKNVLKRTKDRLQCNPDLLDLTKLLLKIISRQYGINQSLIANKDDLQNIALSRTSRASKGWRYQLFGNLAEGLVTGKVSIKFENQTTVLYKRVCFFSKKLKLDKLL